MKWRALSTTWILIKKIILMHYVLGGLCRRIFITHVTLPVLFCAYWKKTFKNQHVWFFFLLFPYSCWGKLIQITLNYFTSSRIWKQKKTVNFNDIKGILNKKNPQVISARDFRASILACKDYKINTKTWIIVILLVLFFSAFRPLELFTLCSHATKFSSFSTCYFALYIKIEIFNLEFKIESLKNMTEC